MKWLALLGTVLLACGVLLGVLARVGARLPRTHVAARRVLIHRPAAEIFATLRDFARASEWRKDVERVELLEERDGHVRFRETSRHGVMTFEVTEEVPGTRLVTRIADDDLPFGGTWTYELRTTGGATEVAITERGFVKPVIFRALAKYVFGHDRTLVLYLRALGQRLGEKVVPEAAAIPDSANAG